MQKINEQAPKGRYEDMPLEELTLEELKETKFKNLEERTRIQSQIDRQSADFVEQGINGDIRWTNSAKAAIRYKGVLDQRIAAEIGRRKQQQKETNIGNAENEDRWFRKAAHHHLSGADFDAILKLAAEMEAK